VLDSAEVFRFGRFELDLRSRELRKDRVRIRLQDQPFQVLATLLEHPGEVLTRETLRARLWPEGTFVDFEHGLNAAIKRLRDVLGDSADHPRFVETLHRRGYRFIGRVERSNGDDAPLEGPPAPASADKKLRLAVLPFSNLGDVPAHEYFTDGLTEELITELGRICVDRLGIVARASSMLVQRSAQTVREIGEALRADYLIQGTVRCDADRVRITVQLVDTGSETHLWAESYERRLSDCFQVQADVAARIGHSLVTELVRDHHEPRPNGTRHVAAYRAYLKGRYHWNRPGDEGLEQSVAYFDEAIALDPTFSAAYAALGRAHLSIAEYYVREPRQALEAARAAASRSLELGAADSESYLTLAEVHRTVEWDWTAAESAFRRAVALNPSNGGAHRLYALFLAGQARVTEADAAARRAYDLDPLCLVVNTSAGWVSYVARNYDATIEHCRHALDMDSGFAPARRLMAAALVQLGNLDAAANELNTVLAAREDPTALAWLAHQMATAGCCDRAVGLLRRLEEVGRRQYVSPCHRALAHVAFGDLDTTFALLDRACTERDPAVLYLSTEPRFDVIRADSRYEGLMGRLVLEHAAS
jgi:TolB-like protein/tetratricopeptide (TPR) repeat protein